MYSDLLESSSKDNFSFNDFNDQPSSFDMTEVNEISNQTNLDYIFDSYYSTVSNYNTSFDLPEDCKNMSFSELFDQELFSTHENKDCKLTIKIEKEEPLNPCYSADNLQDTTVSHSPVKSMENIFSSTSSKSFAPKRGINRTSIKVTKNCDVERLIQNPFYEPENLDDQLMVKVRKPIIKCEPVDLDDIVELTIKPGSVNDSQNKIESHSLIKVEDNTQFSLPKNSSQKHSAINNSSIKNTKNQDIKHFIDKAVCETDNLVFDQIEIPIAKHEPEEANDLIEQDINLEINPYYSSEDSQTQVVGHSLVKGKKNIQSSLLKSSTPKDLTHHKTSLKNADNYNNKKLEDLGLDQKPVKIKRPIIKIEPEEVDAIIKQEISIQINPYSTEDSQNQKNSHNLVKKKNEIQSSLLKSSIPKRSVLNETSLKITEHNDYKNLKNLGLDQTSIKIEIPIIKREPEEINDIIEQEINMEINPYSTEDSQNRKNSHNLVKKKNEIQSSLLKSSIPKHSVLNETSLKITEHYDYKNLKKLSLDQTSIKIEIPIIKREPEEINDIIEQEINMEINPYSTDDSQNKKDSLNLIKINENIQSSLFKSSTTKLSVINKTFLKASKNHGTNISLSNNLFKTENMSFEPMSEKMITPYNKSDPENIDDILEQDIEMQMKQCFSYSGSQNKTENCNKNIKNNSTSLLSKDFTSKHLGINHTSLKTSENYNVKHIVRPSFCKLDGLVNDQMTAKVKVSVNESEHEDLNDTVDQNSVGMEIHLEEENLLNEETSNYTGLEDFCCNNMNCTKTDDQNIAIIKKKSIIPNITSVKNDDIETSGNDITLETEKKKISWEEYKAKVGKIGLSKISGNNDERVTDIAVASNDKLETVKEEFDRNTAEHFIGQKRKIEDKGQQKKNAKEMNSEEDQELQNKRMKIEYIKKLLPSSFASEIAKTSSLMKGNNYVDDTENESTSDDSLMSSDKTHGKITDTHLKRDEKSLKKFHQTRVNSSHRSSSRTDYCNKSSRLSSSSSSSSSNPDDYYNRNRIDVLQNGQYNQNIRNTVQRSRDQKRVVYVGQIPIKFGKRYLYNRFKMFGTIQSLTLHKKPDFRVYYAFVTYSEKLEAERAINHGNDDESQVQLDIRFGERKQTQTPYYDLDDEWLTDWYGYNQPVPVVRAQSPEKTSFEEELQEFYKLAQIKKSNQIKSSQVS